MISEINCENIIYINMHMEQVYSSYVGEFFSERDFRLDGKKEIYHMKSNDLTFETINRLSSYIKSNIDKKIVLDFQNDKMTGIQNNLQTQFKNILNENIYIINLSNELKAVLKLDEKNFDVQKKGYYDAFETIKFDYLKKISEPKFYQSANGVILEKYINIKKIIENNSDLFKWCYILCNNLCDNGLFKEKNRVESSKPILLAHTLNGVCIATIISKLMNLDMIYIDHLGPKNRIAGGNFMENYQPYQNYLLVVDFVCQGNEILRAQNIVEFIGGKYIGFIGMVVLLISPISKYNVGEDIIKEAVVKIEKNDIIQKLEYTINTEISYKG